jgi:2-polyprenyl-6-methoxyphenol hydroxylase-like FAD-dependent oxidoreductase
MEMENGVSRSQSEPSETTEPFVEPYGGELEVSAREASIGGDVLGGVLIVGAGPTGLTLAIDLARRKIPFRLIEAAPKPSTGSRGKGLQPRTLEVFDDLGVIDTVLDAGALYPKLRMHAGPFSWRAGSLGSSKPATEDVPYPNLWMVPQARTEEILRDRLCALRGRVEFGCALVNFTQDEDGVQAALSSGETVRADYLVGCDGARSIVRKTLGLDLVGESLAEKLTLVADVGVEGLERRDWHMWPLAKGGPMGLCPLPGTELFQLTASALVEEHIEQAVKAATGYRVAHVAWRSTYRAQVRMVERYRVGRILLAGDAAHVHPPSGGQGLNTGVQDVFNLGWKLAHVLRGGPPDLLDTYEAERLPIAAAVLGLSKRLLQTRSFQRGDLTNQLGLHYRTSPLSTGSASGNLHPGDRMPDARLEDGSRLFDRMRGPHATVVVTPDGAKFLVRPDGYIASIGSEEVAEYAGEKTRIIRIGAYLR